MGENSGGDGPGMEAMTLINRFKELDTGSACGKSRPGQAQACSGFSTSKAEGTHFEASRQIHTNLSNQNHANALTSNITSNLMNKNWMFLHTHLSLWPSHSQKRYQHDFDHSCTALRHRLDTSASNVPPWP